MRILSLLFLLISFSSLSQDKSVLIKTPIYEVMYSEVLEQPIWIKYKVQCTDGRYPRKGMDFYLNDSVHTSDDQDYVNNIYDKGHLAPAADFNCSREMLFMTFSYLNCALQNEDLNRGVWKKLELYERELAKKYSVYVTVECTFSKNSNRLSTGATVPDGFRKKIRYSGKTMVFYFPNVTPAYLNILDYLVK